MITALASAALTLNRPDYAFVATQTAQFIKRFMYIDGSLLRCFRGSVGDVPAVADDYAFLIQGSLLLVFVLTIRTPFLVRSDV
jgi:uncharacterized protein YyaL (SSP411 family)